MLLSVTLDWNPAVHTHSRARSAIEQAHRRHACSDRRPVGEPQPAETGVQVTGLIATPVSTRINPGIQPGSTRSGLLSCYSSERTILLRSERLR